MVDIQHEPDVMDRLVASSDAEHLSGTTRFDDKQNFTNTAPTEMNLPMYVDPPKAPPPYRSAKRKMKIALMAVIIIITIVEFVYLICQVIRVPSYISYEPYDTFNKQQQPKSENKMNRPKQSGGCVVPSHPENGKYIIKDAPTAKPGESLDAMVLTVNCLPDYILVGSETDSVLCVNGTWSSRSLPKCVRFCKLDNNTSARYYCSSTEGRRPCNTYVPLDTVVSPECNNPNDALITHHSMRCINGSWDHVANCSQECGRVTSNGVALIVGGRPADRGELPWHVGVYQKDETPYKQICGGSIVSNSVVISAAHCFWNDVEKKLPASKFAVAAGKIYRDWDDHDDQNDAHAQKSDVKEINIPLRFRGNIMNFQEDIAVLILETPFEYTAVVGHVCLSFDDNLEKKQLQHGNLGKVTGWGITEENGKNWSQILKVIELPYVDITQCIEASSLSFKGHITSDKICVGFGNGKAPCRGDSGGGFVFLDSDRYYLRGIVSTAPRSENDCNIHESTTFTQITKHVDFIRMYI